MLIFSLKFDQSYPFTQMTDDSLSKLRNSEPGGGSPLETLFTCAENVVFSLIFN